jgi:hypothetical protein
VHGIAVKQHSPIPADILQIPEMTGTNQLQTGAVGLIVFQGKCKSHGVYPFSFKICERFHDGNPSVNYLKIGYRIRVYYKNKIVK